MFAALAAAAVLPPAAVTLETWQGHGSSAAAVGDQVQYVHAPFAWVTKYWEQQGKPKPARRSHSTHHSELSASRD